MERVNAIWGTDAFRSRLELIERAEADREFCRHGLAHLLDVARIAWAFNLERSCGLSRDVVYAAALLHDLGRSAQYVTGEPHDEAGMRIAAEVLDALPEDTRFDAAERAAIIAAVGGHRGPLVQDGADASGAESPAEVLSALIKEADGSSRPCYACPAREVCYWPDERKNLSIER